MLTPCPSEGCWGLGGKCEKVDAGADSLGGCVAGSAVGVKKEVLAPIF